MNSFMVAVLHKVSVWDYVENSTLLGQPPSTGTYYDTISCENCHTKEKKEHKKLRQTKSRVFTAP
jgi:hypothetical protein